MNELIYKLLILFISEKPYINDLNEIILAPKGNIYFRLEDVKTELDLKCKVIAWLSRSALKFQYYHEEKYSGKYDEYGNAIYIKNSWGIKKNKEIRNKCIKAINQICGTNFNKEQIELIYIHLGNDINRKLTIQFIESGYDLNLLK